MLRGLVPRELQIQEFDGTSWVGLVPFRMQGVMRRPLPDLPWVSAFPECNLRLYVEHGRRPGVWFLSLDATNPLAVWAARRFFHLPYYRARMSLGGLPEQVQYRSVRVSAPRGVELRATYQPTSDAYEAAAGTLEHWLTERYCLYAQAPDGRLLRTEVHHHPWPLQAAQAQFECNSFFEPHGLKIQGPPTLLHFSRRLDVVVWSPVTVAA